jgi:hypothetical protein
MRDPNPPFIRQINKSWNQIADTNLMNIIPGATREYPSSWFVIGPTNDHHHLVSRKLDLSKLDLRLYSRASEGGYVNNSFDEIFELLPQDIQEDILFNLDMINQ